MKTDPATTAARALDLAKLSWGSGWQNLSAAQREGAVLRELAHLALVDDEMPKSWQAALAGAMNLALAGP